jgi:catechol 2,3-dioxygenase-like lactoylglutathione lyase family enzyme
MNCRALIFTVAAISAAPMYCQLAAPSPTGDAIGHVHLNVTDIDAQVRFWTQVGGTPVNNEKLQMMQFPGIFIILRKQDPTGGTVGSAINHFGFHVKDFDASIAKYKAAGISMESAGVPKQMFLNGPDGVRVEILEDASIKGPVEMHHIHIFVPDPVAAQAWYVKNFGAIAGKRGQFNTATVPGAEIAFTKVDALQIPSKGRAADHMGFEVKSIDQFVKQLEASGIQPEAAIRTSPNASKLRIAFLTDPWGTYIELTEGLTPAK